MKIKPVKGRPMLHWVGKRPIDTISNYPAQLVDTYDVENPEKEPTYGTDLKTVLISFSTVIIKRFSPHCLCRVFVAR